MGDMNDTRHIDNMSEGNNMTEMSEAAKQARRDYSQKWRDDNRDHVNAYARKWRSENRDKVRAYQSNYWEKVAQNAGK